MSIVFILFSTLLLVVPLSGREAQNEVIVRLSEQKVEARTLKAILTSCKDNKKLQNGDGCGSQVEIKAWLDMDDPQSKFLVIDEVYDVGQKRNLRLLHPYMLQVSNVEQSMTFPLNIVQIVEVSCEVKDSVHRRQSEGNYHESRRMNLIFYIPPARTTTKKLPIIQKLPQSSLETMSGTYSVEKQKIRLKLNPKSKEQPRNRVEQGRSPVATEVDYRDGDLVSDAVNEEKSGPSDDQEHSDLDLSAEKSVDVLAQPQRHSMFNQPQSQSQNLLRNGNPGAYTDENLDYHHLDSLDSQPTANEVGMPERPEAERPNFVPAPPATNSDARNNRIIEAKSNLHKKRVNDRLQLLMDRSATGT